MASALSADRCATRRSHLGSAHDGDEHHDAVCSEIYTASVEVPITSTMAGRLLAGHGLGAASVLTSVSSVEGAPKAKKIRGLGPRVQLPREPPPPPHHAALIAIRAIGECTRER